MAGWIASHRRSVFASFTLAALAALPGFVLLGIGLIGSIRKLTGFAVVVAIFSFVGALSQLLSILAFSRVVRSNDASQFLALTGALAPMIFGILAGIWCFIAKRKAGILALFAGLALLLGYVGNGVSWVLVFARTLRPRGGAESLLPIASLVLVLGGFVLLGIVLLKLRNTPDR
jgi:hypothetical protein